MDSKKLRLMTALKPFAAVVLLLLTSGVSSLFAQTKETSDFYVERRFIQRLTWSGNEFASRYEIIIENEENGNYRRAHQAFSTDFFLEISLPPGRYRYSVIPYDFLDRPGAGTEWIDFEILAAVYPQLIYSIPELYLSGEEKPVFTNEYTLMIYGANISLHSEIFIRFNNSTIISPSNTRIYADRQSARLVFKDIDQIPEVFDVVVRNPGDLETSMETYSYISSAPDKEEAFLIFSKLDSIPESLWVFLGLVKDEPEPEPEEIEPIPPPPSYDAVDQYFALSFTPLFSLYETIVFQHEATSVLSAATLQLGFIRTAENSFLGFGMEAAMSLYSFNVTHQTYFQEEYFQIFAAAFEANLLIQKLTDSKRMAFRFRAGGGYTFLFNDHYQDSLPKPFHINVGASFLLFAGRFYLQTGADMICWIYNEEKAGALRPLIGIGWKY